MSDASAVNGGAAAGDAAGASSGGASAPTAGTGATAGGAGGGGGSSEPWYAPFGLDDDARAFLAGKGFSNMADQVKSAMSADRLVRERNVMHVPDADPVKRKEWDGFEKLGWVRDRDQYAVDRPKAPDDSLSYDEGMEKAFLDAAHGARVPTWAAKEILDAVAGYGFKAQQDALANAALESQKLNETLDREWGANAPAQRERARAAATYLGVGAEDASQLEKIVGAPALVKMFAKLGEMLGEDTLKGGASGGAARSGMSPDGARAEMQRLQADKDFIRALQDVRHPQHKANTARYNELIDRANGR